MQIKNLLWKNKKIKTIKNLGNAVVEKYHSKEEFYLISNNKNVLNYVELYKIYY